MSAPPAVDPKKGAKRNSKSPAGGSDNYTFSDPQQAAFVQTDSYTSFKCRIDGIPRPEYRAAATCQRSKKPRFYPASGKIRSSLEAEIDKAMASLSATGKFDLQNASKPVVIKVKFYFTRPKHHYDWSPTKKQLVVPSSAPVFVTKTPDIDNCVKLLLDAMNKKYFKDDNSVVAIHAYKLYLQRPGTVYESGQSKSGSTLFKIVQYNGNNAAMSAAIL
ncbi:holliday junction resolvase [Seminavis robusta]|uniref:Holliday junction resolvase n=1 Tax=Seminavis robusta TaxID=568900 RepID=A0A9N8D8J7_9STRA|nr:holliday junction resolvase [Seminavis robusta]|eukprot:Sro2_g001170.1 holliday junction resolvase (218) ;mRNA; f:40888-41541